MMTGRFTVGKFVTIISAALIILAAGSSQALAAAMPTGHGMFSNNSRICVVCHRTHTATAENLLRSNAGLCQTCHAGGAGADTDVAAGHYVDSASDPNNWGVVGNPLLGGGFGIIDGAPTAYGTNPTRPGTSQHQIGGAPITPYGSASGASISMTCTSCHTIHSNFAFGGQYRLLRFQVGDSNPLINLKVFWNGPWEGAAMAVPHAAGGTYMGYTENNFGPGLSNIADPRPIEYTRNYSAGLSAWCNGCHSVYGQPIGAYDIGDGQGAVSRHKHVVDVPLASTGRISGTPQTDLPLNDKIAGGTDIIGRSSGDTINCLTCHRAHGTDAKMTGFATLSSFNRGVLPKGSGASMLLRSDNRSVCINCHRYLNEY